MEFSNVALLTSSNWETWRIEVKVLLMHYGAWDFIVNPESESNQNVTAKEKTTEKDESQKDLSWKERSELNLRKARSYTIIFQSLSPEFKPLISHMTNGAEAWKILKEHFEPTTRARVIQLLDNFFSLRYSATENLGLFLCKVKQAAEHLREVGHTLQPLYLGYQMIRSLPVEFQPIVQTIYRWPDTEFVPDKIETELLLEENRLRFSQQDFSGAGNVAFAGELTKSKSGNASKFKNVNKINQ